MLRIPQIIRVKKTLQDTQKNSKAARRSSLMSNQQQQNYSDKDIEFAVKTTSDKYNQKVTKIYQEVEYLQGQILKLMLRLESYENNNKPTSRRETELIETTNRYLSEKRFFKAMALYYQKHERVLSKLIQERPELEGRYTALSIQENIIVAKTQFYGISHRRTQPQPSDFNADTNLMKIFNG